MIPQVGALPYRTGRGGKVREILLITSRQTGRWVLPKGNLILGKAPHEAAAIEAEEEAGVRGPISPLPLGRYRYVKGLSDTAGVEAEVELFALEVRSELRQWKEKTQRERRWFAPLVAADSVDEDALRALIDAFASGHGPRPAR